MKQVNQGSFQVFQNPEGMETPSQMCMSNLSPLDKVPVKSCKELGTLLNFSQHHSLSEQWGNAVYLTQDCDKDNQ